MQEILFQKGNLSPQHLDAALFLAEIAQSAGRHADAITFLNAAVRLKTVMRQCEYEILRNVWKELANGYAVCWRTIMAAVKREEADHHHGHKTAQLALEYRRLVSADFRTSMEAIITLIDASVLIGVESFAVEVKLYKMKGDSLARIAETTEGTEKQVLARMAQRAYESAHYIAEDHLAVTHAARLETALHHATFLLTMQQNVAAHRIASKAFSDAIESLNESDPDYGYVHRVMQMLRDLIASIPNITPEMLLERTEKIP